jgi:hypothetical protein
MRILSVKMELTKTEQLDVKIPSNERKLLQMIRDKLNKDLNNILEDNISFILNNVDLFNTKLRRVKSSDSTIKPKISLEEYDSLNEIAKKRHTSIEKLIASAVPLIILKYKDVLLETAEEHPNKSEFIKNELDNLENDFLLFSE